MKRQTLEFDLDFNFMVFAISCHDPDYKLSLQINSALGIQLEKDFPLRVKDEKYSEDFLFSFFNFIQDDIQLEYQLISNKSYNLVKEKESGETNSIQASLFEENEKQSIAGKINYFMGELSSFDYLFIIRKGYNLKFAKKIEDGINSIESVLKINYIEVEDLKCKELLILE